LRRAYCGAETINILRRLTGRKIEIFRNWGKLGFFQVFFLISGANPCFWAKNGGWYVNLRGLGDIGKKSASKNVEKLAKIGIN